MLNLSQKVGIQEHIAEVNLHLFQSPSSDADHDSDAARSLGV
jgi:hypothetical protein